MSIDEAADENEVRPGDIETWREEFLAEAEKQILLGEPKEDAVTTPPYRELRGIWVCAAGRESLIPACLSRPRVQSISASAEAGWSADSIGTEGVQAVEAPPPPLWCV